MSINKLTVAFTATNYGTITAPNVIGTLTEPALGISLVKVTTQKGTYNSTTKEWAVGDIPAGKSYGIVLEYNVTDINEAPFSFTMAFVSDEADADPLDNAITKIYQASDIYPCPDCGPPSITLNDTSWYAVHGKIDFTANCQECDTEITLVPMSEVNVTSVTIDPATGFYSAVITQPSLSWSFDVEASCTNCPYWCNGGNDFGPYGPKTVSGSGPCCISDPPRYDEDDIQSGTTITLPSQASSITQVFRNGLLLLENEYTFSGPSDTVTFVDAFDIGEGSVGESVSIFYNPV